jgi:hypothetical protein
MRPSQSWGWADADLPHWFGKLSNLLWAPCWVLCVSLTFNIPNHYKVHLCFVSFMETSRYNSQMTEDITRLDDVASDFSKLKIPSISGAWYHDSGVLSWTFHSGVLSWTFHSGVLSWTFQVPPSRILVLKSALTLSLLGLFSPGYWSQNPVFFRYFSMSCCDLTWWRNLKRFCQPWQHMIFW